MRCAQAVFASQPHSCVHLHRHYGAPVCAAGAIQALDAARVVVHGMCEGKMKTGAEQCEGSVLAVVRDLEDGRCEGFDLQDAWREGSYLEDD